MQPPEKRIIRFIRRHHVLTLATTNGSIPWCAHCFYVYLEDIQGLVFTSDPETRHIQEALKQPAVAGGIVLETRKIGKIRGIQFEGMLEEPRDALLKQARNAYLKRFPYAVIMNTKFWIIRLTRIKMTDNRLGFGKKLIWVNNKAEIPTTSEN